MVLPRLPRRRDPRSVGSDRRQNRRFVLGADEEEILLEYPLDASVAGSTRLARVVDMSEGGLRVQFPPGTKPPARGARIEGTLIGVGWSRSMKNLVVLRGAHFGETQTATLNADDDETRAALWYAVERMTYGDAWPDPGGMGSTAERRAMVVPKIPARGIYTEEARVERLVWLREKSKKPLAALEATRLSAEKLTGNVENFIGAIEVPVGLAGPLLFRGHEAKGFLCAPLATTEGALVASATRGATAISRSGGVTTRVIGQRMMRVPLFVIGTLHGAFLFADWIREHVDSLREQTRRVSRHAELMSVEPVILGRMVHVYFLYQTGDAAGQNMTTACTWTACQWLMKQMAHYDEVKFENFVIEANMSGDKKVTYSSFIRGRGIRVVADAHIDGAILKSVLKISPEELYTTYTGVQAGSIQAGMVGFNINVANVIAAMFTATGQDIACVHESSVAQLHMTVVQDGIHASMVLPSLIIGTVGGGTHLPAQHALLESMGCAGAGTVRRLAEIIAGFCLALDLSTLSAVASGEFANAHERLGRNRPVRWFTNEDLGIPLFEPALRRYEEDPGLRLQAIEPLEVKTGSSIVSDLTARKVSKLVGLLPRRLSYRTSSGTLGVRDVMVKVKPLDEEVILMVNTMASQCGARVGAAHNRHRHMTGFAACHIRELAIYEQKDPRFVRNAPGVLFTHREDAREAFVVALERLRPEDMAIMDSEENPRAWTRKAIEAALRGLADLHAIWYGREKELLAQPWIGHVHTARTMSEMSDLWDALAVHASVEFPELITSYELDQLRDFVATVSLWWPHIESMPRTLVHNDFNPRNIAMRQLPGGELRLCAYDWELATMHLPQHDIAELFAFVLSPRVNRRTVEELLEVARKNLEAATRQAIDPQAWRDGYLFCLQDLAINRFGLYLMAHTFRHYGFMERTVKTLWHLIAMELHGKDVPPTAMLSGRFLL